MDSSVPGTSNAGPPTGAARDKDSTSSSARGRRTGAGGGGGRHKQSLRDRVTGLSFEEAPETGKFNSPLPNSAGDPRNLDNKLKDREPKWMDMTGKRGAKRATPAGEPARGGGGGNGSDDEDELLGGVDGSDDDGDGGGAEEGEGTGEGPAPKRKWSNKRNATSTGRRKISIQYIGDKSKRHVSFTKRKAGLMKKVRKTGEELMRLIEDNRLTHLSAWSIGTGL